ncbi:hypothetical protein GCM10027174_25870 [Salinifilum aidingensis]
MLRFLFLLGHREAECAHPARVVLSPPLSGAELDIRRFHLGFKTALPGFRAEFGAASRSGFGALPA